RQTRRCRQGARLLRQVPQILERRRHRSRQGAGRPEEGRLMRLLCAGEAFEDLIFVGLDRLPELGEEIKTDRFTATIGGGAVITSVKAARPGMRTQLLSALCDAPATRPKNETVA